MDNRRKMRRLTAKKVVGALIDFWYIWLGLGGFLFILAFTFFQFILSNKLREYRFMAWPRIFMIVVPSFSAYLVAYLMIPELFLNSQLACHFGENAEGAARNIELIISYIGGILITLFIGIWKKKNLPLRRAKFIDNALDKIFGKDGDEEYDVGWNEK